MDADAVVIFLVALYLLAQGRLNAVFGRITGAPGITGTPDPGTPATTGVGSVSQSPGVAAGPATYGTNPFAIVFRPYPIFTRTTGSTVTPAPVPLSDLATTEINLSN